MKIEKLQLLNALLYVAENGCKWRTLPEKYGKWHTVYMSLNRWSKSGVLQRMFEGLQQEGIIQIKMKNLCLDSTTVKVHPDGKGAFKQVEDNLSDAPGEG